MNTLENEELNKLLQCINLLIEDCEFETADSKLDQILDMEPTNAEAYFLKTLVNHKARSVNELIAIKAEVNADPDFIRALRYADDIKRDEWQGIFFDIEQEPIAIEPNKEEISAVVPQETVMSSDVIDDFFNDNCESTNTEVSNVLPLEKSNSKIKKNLIIGISAVAAVLVIIIIAVTAISSNRKKGYVESLKSSIVAEYGSFPLGAVFDQYLASVKYKFKEIHMGKIIVEVQGKLKGNNVTFEYRKSKDDNSYYSNSAYLRREWTLQNIRLDDYNITKMDDETLEACLFYAYSEDYDDFADFLLDNKIYEFSSSTQKDSRKNISYNGNNVDWLKSCRSEDYQSITNDDVFGKYLRSLIYKQYTENDQDYVEVSGKVNGKRVVLTFSMEEAELEYYYNAVLKSLTINGRSALYKNEFEGSLLMAYSEGYDRLMDFMYDNGVNNILEFIGD